jgi:5-methyltetrahydrofolate--homocysteine methyltransferase
VHSLRERIAEGRPLVADGAMGTMLLARGLKAGECPESISLTHPELLEEIARSYLDAGADIIQTNTFGASPLKLAFHGLQARTREINSSAVLAVRRAIGHRAYVLASCGPSGRMLKPYGDVDPQEMQRSFREQMDALVEAGVDAICVETMTDCREAALAIQAAKEAAPRTPVMATMTFDRTPRGFYTIMGVTPETAVKELEAAGADVIGSNCGNGIENMIAIAAQFRRISRLPVIIQSNAGMPELRHGTPVYPETPEFMAEKTKDLLALGVSIIGGCCGTTLDHIRAIRQVVDQHIRRAEPS